MTMIIEDEQFKYAIWWVLKEIQEHALATPEGRHIEFECEQSNDPSIPRPTNQAKAVKLLAKEGAIEIKSDFCPPTEVSTLYKPNPFFNHTSSISSAEITGSHTKFSDKRTFWLFVLQPKFDELYKKFQEVSSETEAGNKASIISVIFNDEEANLVVDGNVVPLPSFRNEHYLCRAMWRYPMDEFVSWDTIYQEISGYYEQQFGKPSSKRETWRIVYDAMERLNKRINEVTGTKDDLFSWSEKTIKRNF